MNNYIVGFEIDNSEVYVFIKNTSNGNTVFYEKVTDEVLSVAKEYSELIEG